MTRHEATLPLIVLVLLAGTAAPAGGSPQKEQEEQERPGMEVVVEGVARRQIPLVVPRLQIDPQADEDVRGAADLIREVLTADLAYSGQFNVLPPSLYPTVIATTGRLPLRQFAAIGAEGVVFGTVAAERAGSLVVEGLLFDSKSEALIIGKRYRGGHALARDIAHRIADAVTIAYTGRSGVYLSRIVFVAKIGDAKEIFVMDYDGADLKQITKNKSLNMSPAWSPDGRRLAFVSYRQGTPRLYVYDGQDGRLTDASPEGSELSMAPDWSPDGRRIAFASAKQGNSEIFVLDVGSGGSRQITFSPGADTAPAWSPSGREIAFTSDRAGRPQIYLMDAEGANVRRLTDTGDFSDSAAWSPSGGRLAYASRLKGRFEILVMDVASGEVWRLTQNARNNESPRWSPDGRHIVFASNRSGRYQLYTMDADGNRQEQIRTRFEAIMPDWSR